MIFYLLPTTKVHVNYSTWTSCNFNRFILLLIHKLKIDHYLQAHMKIPLASFSSNSSMHTRSIDVAPNHVCFLTRRGCLLLQKNSTIDVLIVSMSWIIVCANYIFSLYAFLFAHSKDDDECDGDLTTNNWIFNTPSLYAFSQLLFYFCFLQWFCFLLLPSSMLTPLHFLFPCYLL